MNQNTKRRWLAALLGAAAGMVVFFLLYGTSTLHPTYDAWILNGYDEWDIQQHYAGWVLFRNSHWAFPLGLADTIAAPDGTVISFTDSIPWVSIFFKALRGVLPSTFQWFGWYTLFCFAMQGAAGALLCARGQAKTGAGALVFSTLGGLLFVMLPTLWERAFRHTALASQWLFLLALYAFLEYRQNLHSGTAKFPWAMPVLAFLAVGIHPYFLPLVMMCALLAAVELGRQIGYPVMVRPSFVLGGRGMEVIYDEENLKRYGVEAIQVSPEYPMLIDRFLDNAIEAEVDALADGTDTFVATVMEHIELAGIHSGDSACAIPPVTIAPKHVRTIEEHAAKIARDFQVKGILNVQFAICDDEVYIIEANPRASRTVPIVSKVTGISMARHATEIMLGKKLKDMNLKPQPCRFIGVKEAVFPFNMFPEVDPVLGPEMRATGEVMGIADNFGMAYYKAQEAAGCILPTSGKVLVTVSDRDKKFIEPIARDLISLGFQIVSTGGTAEYLRGQGVETEVVNKLHEGRPNLGDMITNKQIDLIINTPVDRTSMIDDSFIRMQSIQKKIPYMTTIAAARATVEGIRSAQHVKVSPRSLQEYHS